jgi:Fe-Mn family superoxide dismutase
MKPFEEKKFDIPELKGISKKNIEEHLKLYSGYVKNLNGIFKKVEELVSDFEKNAYVVGELMRRVGFEFNGMRNHEVYFESLSGGAQELPEDSLFKKETEKMAPSFDEFMAGFKTLALTRGIGWAMLYWDPVSKSLVPAWIDEQHLGQLQGCSPVLAIDMWEHSYVADYQPSGKKQYIEDFLTNLNWLSVEERFKKAL